MRRTRIKVGSGRSGGALLISIIATMVIAGMTAAMLTVSTASHRENRAATDEIRALYAAEAGLTRTIVGLRAGTQAATFGTTTTVVPFGKGGFWGSVVDHGDGTYTVDVFGRSGAADRGIEAVLTSQLNPIYSHALFAGNSGGDPTYSLDLGGCGDQADSVIGNVYSGNEIQMSCDAAVNGTLRAAGGIRGSDGEEGITQPIPDIAGMDYQHNHDFDVAQMFAAATWERNAAGGMAWQVPESNPAHIFRKNPSDRVENTRLTSKDDYFLEDPYEPVSADRNQNGRNAYHITLSGTGGSPGPSGNQKVYYVDGNLWLHNKRTFSFKLYTPSNPGLRVTFIVRGNIYFGDNLFYKNKNKDGIAFVAIKDENEPDSGNIYFGDPAFGTLREMNAFMFAENNFYDTNLDASGSSQVLVHGNMTAGNQVAIDRDYDGAHSKLTVELDDRIMSGRLALPGLPGFDQGGLDFTLASWREIPVP
jgi:hypothetical protein